MTVGAKTTWNPGDPQPDGIRRVWDDYGEQWDYDDEDGRWSYRDADGTITIPWDDLTFGYGPISSSEPPTRMDNPPAAGVPTHMLGWRWGFLLCGCLNDGYGNHVR